MIKYIAVAVGNGLFVTLAWGLLQAIQSTLGGTPTPLDWGTVFTASAAGAGNAYLWSKED